MFIPIGDNIERRSFPFVTIVLIVANVLVFIIQLRTSYEAMDAAEAALHGRHLAPRDVFLSRSERSTLTARTALVQPSAASGQVARGQFETIDDYEFTDDYESDPWSAYDDESGWSEEIAAEHKALVAAHQAQFEFIKRWGLTPAELKQGQVVGLLTHMFLHGDIFHLLGNMIVLWAFAATLEAGFGHCTFLGFYILFGLAGGVAQCATDFSSDIPLIGASGAVAGLIGAYTVLYGPFARLKMLFFFMYRAFTFEMPAAAFGFGWFLLQMLQASIDDAVGGGVAWFAHIGGFLAGVAVTYICRHDTEQEIAAEVDGRLVLQYREGSQSAPAASSAEAAAQTAAPTTCPYCHEDLSKGHPLAPTLIRCGNESCQRMVYLDPSPVNDLALAGRRR
jgi:membrane associated rhomboid family serine protease